EVDRLLRGGRGDLQVLDAVAEHRAGQIDPEAGHVVRSDLQTDRHQGAVGRGQRHHRATGAGGDRVALRDQAGAHQLLDQLGDGGLGEPRALGQAGAGGRGGRGGGGGQGGEDGGEVVLTQVCGLHLGLLAVVPGGAATGRHPGDLCRQLGTPTLVTVTY